MTASRTVGTVSNLGVVGTILLGGGYCLISGAGFSVEMEGAKVGTGFTEATIVGILLFDGADVSSLDSVSPFCGDVTKPSISGNGKSSISSSRSSSPVPPSRSAMHAPNPIAITVSYTKEAKFAGCTF